MGFIFTFVLKNEYWDYWGLLQIMAIKLHIPHLLSHPFRSLRATCPTNRATHYFKREPHRNTSNLTVILTNIPVIYDLICLVKQKQALLESNLPGIAKHRMSGSAFICAPLLKLILVIPKKTQSIILTLSYVLVHSLYRIYHTIPQFWASWAQCITWNIKVTSKNCV